MAVISGKHSEGTVKRAIIGGLIGIAGFAMPACESGPSPEPTSRQDPRPVQTAGQVETIREATDRILQVGDCINIDADPGDVSMSWLFTFCMDRLPEATPEVFLQTYVMAAEALAFGVDLALIFDFNTKFENVSDAFVNVGIRRRQQIEDQQ